MLYAFCFPPHGNPFLAYLFAAPVYIAAKARPVSFKAWCLLTFVGVYAVWFFLLIWIRHVYPPAGYLAMLFLPLAVTAFVWPYFALLYKLAPSSREWALARLFKIVGLAGLWVSLEYLRSFMFTGFPWLLLGHSQWNMPATMYAASFGGVWIVSYFAVFFGMVFAEYFCRLYAWHADKIKTPLFEKPASSRFCPEFYLGAFFIIGGVWGYIAALPKSSQNIESFRAGLVQTDFAGILKWDKSMALDNMRVIRNLTSALKNVRADAAFWPEAATPPIWPVIGVPQMRDFVEDLSKTEKLPIIMGNMAYFADAGGAEGYSQNCIFAVSEESGLDDKSFYSKRKLVPFGEYVPFWFSFAESVVPVGSLKPGQTAQILNARIAGKDYKVGALICYEDIFPSLGREVRNAGADFIFVATNDSWYGREGGGWQHLAHSALQAVSLGLPVVRAANNGVSAVFDRFGRMAPCITLQNTQGKVFEGADAELADSATDITSESGALLNPYTLRPVRSSAMLNAEGSPYFRGVAYADVIFYENREPTFYAIFGDWFAAFCGVSALFALSTAFFARKRAQN